MISAIKQRFDREDEGFTLIELMVVVLIIAILLAIAIPTFLGARDSANSRATQSDLRNATTAEQEVYQNTQDFDYTGTALATIETSLTFVSAGPVTPGNTIMVAQDATNNGVVLTASGKDSHCYSVEVINEQGTAAGAITPGTYYEEEKGASGSGATTSCSTPATLPSTTPTQASAGATLGNWSLAW